MIKMIVLDKNSNHAILEETYIALGSFDGLHLGHLSLIDKSIELARKNNAKSMVFTFSNHPLTSINPNKAPKLIMNNEEKIEIIKKIGVDILALVEFDEEFMKISSENFVKFLVENYNAKGIVVGFNYKFGYKNKGNINLLKELSEKYNFELYVMDAYKYKDEVISSSRIRKEIAEGDISEANTMLNRSFSIGGIVIEGKKIGRTIGFNTANLKVDVKHAIPKDGVYYTNVLWKSKMYKGITSVGNNPTVNGQELTIETYILDFSENIYGDYIQVFFVEFIRGMIKFNNVEELKAQLNKDKDFARKVKKVAEL